MRGELVDDFQTYNGLEMNTMHYEMKGNADGIYFFVATGKEGTVARKVVVGR